jgi:DivIVA domain-containing protein
MALTPEDVVNKRFQPTKFREGYDQDEVDDFLDEVVVELRRLNQENEELRQRLIASDSRINELQRSAGQPAPAALEQAAVASAPAPVAAAPAFQQASDPNLDPTNTNNLLQLARRLHEEHVREGVEKRDALIAEGQATATRTVEESQATAARVLDESQSAAAKAIEESQATAARLVEEAQTQTRNQISALDQERSALEDRIEELRNFEREYRSKLKDYIEGQLRELDSDSSAVLAGAPTPAAVGAGAPQASGFDAQSYDAQSYDAPSYDAPSSFDAAPTGFDAQSYGTQSAPPPASYPGFASN